MGRPPNNLNTGLRSPELLRKEETSKKIESQSLGLLQMHFSSKIIARSSIGSLTLSLLRLAQN